MKYGNCYKLVPLSSHRDVSREYKGRKCFDIVLVIRCPYRNKMHAAPLNNNQHFYTLRLAGGQV